MVNRLDLLPEAVPGPEVAGMADKVEPQEGAKGWFAWRLKQLSDESELVDERMARIEQTFDGINAKLDQISELLNPEEIEWIWENFRELTEVISALRRTQGLPALSEFVGTRNRRRSIEKARAASK